MRVTLKTSDTCRKKAFISQGVTLGSTVEVDLDPTTLDQESRSILLNSKGYVRTELQIIAPFDPGRTECFFPVLKLQDYPVDSIPVSSEDWNNLLHSWARDWAKAEDSWKHAAQVWLSQQVHEIEQGNIENHPLLQEVSIPPLATGVSRASLFIRLPREWKDLDLGPVVERYGEVAQAYNDRRLAELAEIAQRVADERAQQEAERKAAREALEAAKAAWIKENGSDFLRRAYGAGYNCQRRYVSERAAMEHAGYVVDFDDNARWESRSCPSEMALDEAERVGGEVVWLTKEPYDETITEMDYYAGDFEPTEAVVIHGYLGKYDLVRIM